MDRNERSRSFGMSVHIRPARTNLVPELAQEPSRESFRPASELLLGA